MEFAYHRSPSTLNRMEAIRTTMDAAPGIISTPIAGVLVGATMGPVLPTTTDNSATSQAGTQASYHATIPSHTPNQTFRRAPSHAAGRAASRAISPEDSLRKRVNEHPKRLCSARRLINQLTASYGLPLLVDDPAFIVRSLREYLRDYPGELQIWLDAPYGYQDARFTPLSPEDEDPTIGELRN